MQKTLRKFGAWFVPKISWITWDSLRSLFNNGVYYSLTEEDWEFLRKALRKDYYIILTRNDSHLSTYLVMLGNLITSGKFGHYAHALMNLEDDPVFDQSYILVEATAKGVHYSTFLEVFRCDSVALLKPKNLTIDEYTAVLDKAMAQIGLPYDNLFDLKSHAEVSCVELVRVALQELPNYSTMFSNLERMIVENDGNLTPEMFYNCPDFEVVWEVRR